MCFRRSITVVLFIYLPFFAKLLISLFLTDSIIREKEKFPSTRLLMSCRWLESKKSASNSGILTRGNTLLKKLMQASLDGKQEDISNLITLYNCKSAFAFKTTFPLDNGFLILNVCLTVILSSVKVFRTWVAILSLTKVTLIKSSTCKIFSIWPY